ncbi:Uncharacterized protein Adt_02885 [Abeliophyllum distichum]|uniref:Retrotransposon gag domain-containing protein n=1 Tax=Abeliophyllum distichum TaxID=126358 RepID=A0ABD1VX61_9LAMI
MNPRNPSQDNQKGRPPPMRGNQPAPISNMFDRVGGILYSTTPTGTQQAQSWPQLKREFVNAFIGNWTMVADIVQLHDIWQKEGETVKSYFKRFSNVINKIEIVTDDKALDALVIGFHIRTLFGETS